MGIGGGYGQFGILTEAEFNTIIKADSKRIKKFHEHPDQFKQQFNVQKYPKKDDGVRLVNKMAVDANGEPCEDDEDDEIVPKLKIGFRPDSQPEMDIVEMAKQRFDYEPEVEARKILELQNSYRINEDDLFGDCQKATSNPIRNS